MQWSKSFIPTLRDSPADAEAASHQLLIRGGFIRQLHSGHYSMLPLGWRVHQKVAQEVLLPAMHPASLWQESGRWEAMGDELFRLVDRKGSELALGMTHEEVIANLGLELSSYRDLPQMWYQIQTKFRDEPRPKSGLLRVREFAMKDSYSLDIDDAGLNESFNRHHQAYLRIFARLDLDALPVEASSGTMGGSTSIEFMVESNAGEDDVVRCTNCDYAANIQRATAAAPEIVNQQTSTTPEEFPTPGIRTIGELCEAGHAAEHQIKTLVYELDGKLVIILLRGDHSFIEQKLVDAAATTNLHPADGDRIRDALGASPGSLGAVGVSDMTIYADFALHGRSGMITGANKDDVHLRYVDIDRDIKVDQWLDLRAVLPNEPCTHCGRPLEVVRCIEAGHIFKLGQKYTETLGVSVLDDAGNKRIPTMGSYGIGVGRAMATIAETHHDDKGLIWPISVAPYEAVLTVVNMSHEISRQLATSWHDELTEAGVDILLDDRDIRPGVKFADAELVGIPFRITIGPKGLDNGRVELTHRSTGVTSEVLLKELVQMLLEAVEKER